MRPSSAHRTDGVDGDAQPFSGRLLATVTPFAQGVVGSLLVASPATGYFYVPICGQITAVVPSVAMVIWDHCHACLCRASPAEPRPRQAFRQPSLAVPGRAMPSGHASPHGAYRAAMPCHAAHAAAPPRPAVAAPALPGPATPRHPGIPDRRQPCHAMPNPAGHAWPNHASHARCRAPPSPVTSEPRPAGLQANTSDATSSSIDVFRSDASPATGPAACCPAATPPTRFARYVLDGDIHVPDSPTSADADSPQPARRLARTLIGSVSTGDHLHLHAADQRRRLRQRCASAAAVSSHSK